MCSVPRVWEKIFSKVKEGIAQSSPTKQKLFDWAFKVGGQYHSRIRDQKPIPAGLNIKYSLAHKLVLGKVQAIFGGRTKVYNCGGAAFSAEISEFFFNAGVLLLQGYGMTECFVITVANPTHNKFGTCGPVVPLMDVKIADDGEILAKGPSMMTGYYKNPELTQESLTEDGYMKTGDIGMIDSEGYLSITDRKKDMMKTSGGKYIAPQHIETLLKEDYYFDNVAVIGDGRQYVSALVVPTFEALENWARSKNISWATREELVKKPEVQEFYRQRIDELLANPFATRPGDYASSPSFAYDLDLGADAFFKGGHMGNNPNQLAILLQPRQRVQGGIKGIFVQGSEAFIQE